MAQKHIYNLQLTEKQATLLSYACDRLSRIIEGQDWTYQEFMEEAWEKRCKEATGKMMDKEWDGGWHNMREEAEKICKDIKKRFWGCDANAMYGIHYDDTADILFDIHQCIRHQLWLDKPESHKSHITVDSDTPMRVGSEPLAIISKGWMIENGEEDCGEPIPLTPEILVKNGFVLDDEWYIYTEQGVNIEVAFRDDNKFVYDLSILTGSGSMDIHAKYLHELQHAMRMFNINKTIEL